MEGDDPGIPRLHTAEHHDPDRINKETVDRSGRPPYSERGKHNRARDDGRLPALPGLYRRGNHAPDVCPMNACTELPGCTVLQDRFGQQAVEI